MKNKNILGKEKKKNKKEKNIHKHNYKLPQNTVNQIIFIDIYKKMKKKPENPKTECT